MKKTSSIGTKIGGTSEVRSKKGWAVSGAYTCEAFPGKKNLSDAHLKTVKKSGDGKFMGPGRMSSEHGTTAGKQHDHPNMKNTFEKCRPRNTLTMKTGGVKGE